MDFEALIKNIIDKTSCIADSIGDEQYPEYRLEFKIEDNRKQELNIFPHQESGKNFIKMLTFIGKKTDFTMNQLVSFLELNMSLRYGAIALFQGQVVMTSMMEIDDKTKEDKIIQRIQYLVKMADSFEKTMVGLDRK